ncbi:Uncharacterized protein dnm_013100 [Desulfonema magnum]|uniref:Uncharacterized protein n=1 Tax=Desulfonema magnum TaxID=45655 RepID=A0A975GL84_9BACT|nr:Uncharacterized protein dnm_013100 [Desulfonema magnum]
MSVFKCVSLFRLSLKINNSDQSVIPENYLCGSVQLCCECRTDSGLCQFRSET